MTQMNSEGGYNMNTIQLNNGIDMPVLGFGTFMLGGEVCENAVADAIRDGYRLIDTAEAYGNEEDVGKGIKKSGIDRKELFIVTKVNFKSFEHADTSVSQSLEYLQTDYIDMILIHWPFGNYYKAWRELENLYERGIIRSIGVSNFEPAQLLDLIAYNKVTPVIDQIETNLYCQRVREREWMEQKKVAHMSYAPLGQGNRNEMFEEPDVLSFAEKYGKTPAQILLRFLIQKDIVIIPRSKTPERIRENIDIFDFTLEAQEMTKLEALDKGIAFVGNPNTPELVEMSLTW